MAISAKDAIRKFKVELLQELPLEDPIFFALAERAGLFPSNTGNNIREEKTRAHKVDYFLQHVVEPGAEEYLPKLIKVMKESEFENVKKLTDDIQALLSTGTYVRTYTCYLRMYIVQYILVTLNKNTLGVKIV